MERRPSATRALPEVWVDCSAGPTLLRPSACRARPSRPVTKIVTFENTHAQRGVAGHQAFKATGRRLMGELARYLRGWRYDVEPRRSQTRRVPQCETWLNVRLLSPEGYRFQSVNLGLVAAGINGLPEDVAPEVGSEREWHVRMCAQLLADWKTGSEQLGERAERKGPADGSHASHTLRTTRTANVQTRSASRRAPRAVKQRPRGDRPPPQSPPKYRSGACGRPSAQERGRRVHCRLHCKKKETAPTPTLTRTRSGRSSTTINTSTVNTSTISTSTISTTINTTRAAHVHGSTGALPGRSPATNRPAPTPGPAAPARPRAKRRKITPSVVAAVAAARARAQSQPQSAAAPSAVPSTPPSTPAAAPASPASPAPAPACCTHPSQPAPHPEPRRRCSAPALPPAHGAGLPLAPPLAPHLPVPAAVAVPVSTPVAAVGGGGSTVQPEQQRRPLAAMVREIRRELEMAEGGTIPSVVAEACRQMGVQQVGSLKEQASRCLGAMVGEARGGARE